MLINEIFYSLQGEGVHMGKASIFIRLSRCNLRCSFCDTEFDSGTEMTIEELRDLEGQGLPGVRAPTAPDLSLGTRTDPGLHDVGASEVTGGGALGHECSVLLKGGQTS